MTDVNATVCPAGRPRSPEAEAALAELATAAARALAGAPLHQEKQVSKDVMTDSEVLSLRYTELKQLSDSIRARLNAADIHLARCREYAFSMHFKRDTGLGAEQLAQAADELRVIANGACKALGEGPTP